MLKLLPASHLTEKGNLKTAALASLREALLSKVDLPLDKSERGYSMALAQTEDGRIVYATIAVSIGFADPFAKKEAPVVEVDELEAFDPFA